MDVSLIKYWGGDLEVVNAARVSMGKSKSKLDSADIKLIHYLLKHKHWSPFEHSGFTFLIKCPIAIARQIMRHKWSFNEISARYVEMSEQFYCPDEPFLRE